MRARMAVAAILVTVLPARAEAEVESLALGLHTTCPYGLTA